MLSFYERLNYQPNFSINETDEHFELYEMLVILKKNIQNILNTEPRIDDENFHNLSHSILNYGLPNLKKFNLLLSEDQIAFCSAVEQCVRKYEPRLDNVSVTLELPNYTINTDLTINFKIHATFMLAEVAYPILLQSSLNAISGNISIKEIKNIYE